MTSQARTTTREMRRLQTRERVLGAALAEFRRSGMGCADVNAIAAAAGVAHGTFFFHFPSKEHVLYELEAREEARMAAELERFFAGAHDLPVALTEVASTIKGLERRVGPILFKEILALHFSPSRPYTDSWTDHPVIVLLVREIERVRRSGSAHPEVEAFYSAIFFLLGVYGVLASTDGVDERDSMLTKLVDTAVRGIIKEV